MFVVDHLEQVPQLLAGVYAERIEPPPAGTRAESIRGAVGLFLVGDDGANGTQLAKEIVSSFQY